MDPTATFDTFDHNVLIHRLSSYLHHWIQWCRSRKKACEWRQKWRGPSDPEAWYFWIRRPTSIPLIIMINGIEVNRRFQKYQASGSDGPVTFSWPGEKIIQDTQQGRFTRVKRANIWEERRKERDWLKVGDNGECIWMTSFYNCSIAVFILYFICVKY